MPSAKDFTFEPLDTSSIFKILLLGFLLLTKGDNERHQCYQIVAIVALPHYSIVGFRDNAIMMASRSGLRENRNRERLTRRGTSLHRDFCVTLVSNKVESGEKLHRRCV